MEPADRSSATLEAALRAEAIAMRALEDFAWEASRGDDLRPNICWVENETDAGDDYCRPCAEALISRDGGTLHGGYEDRSESCFAARCGHCGIQLSYCLTEYGLKEELPEYEKRERPLPPSPDDAYEMACVIETARTLVIHGEEAGEAIGRRAIAAAEKALGITIWEAERL